MGQRASNTTDVIFEEVKLTKKNVVGVEGEGFMVAMRTFDRTRPWIAAGAAGLIRRCLDECRQYALDRKAFGVPIAQHQAVQFIVDERNSGLQRNGGIWGACYQSPTVASTGSDAKKPVDRDSFRS